MIPAFILITLIIIIITTISISTIIDNDKLPPLTTIVHVLLFVIGIITIIVLASYQKSRIQDLEKQIKACKTS